LNPMEPRFQIPRSERPEPTGKFVVKDSDVLILLGRSEVLERPRSKKKGHQRIALRPTLFKKQWSPTGKPVVPLKYPSSRCNCVSASHAATTRLSAALSFGATSRRSISIVFAFIHGQARGLLRRRIKNGLDGIFVN